MNEPGQPGTPPANLPTSSPPSYLRSPMPHSPRSLSLPLLLTASLFAIIGIGAFLYLYSAKQGSVTDENILPPPGQFPSEVIEHVKTLEPSPVPPVILVK